ncbi:hypothetical protein C3420_13815 [Acinetobacter sp. ACNIH3]|nr:hypothetical protein C3420_13815 [Acinetobacter sp. ACNIH3]TMS48766.1 hypothetical protein FGQ54_08520 [Acinetobacter lwoffii]
MPTVEGIHLLYLEINKIFSLSCQPICNSALLDGYMYEESPVSYEFQKNANQVIKIRKYKLRIMKKPPIDNMAVFYQ